MNQLQRRNNDGDRLFQALLSAFFREFIGLFLPEVAKDLDWESMAVLNLEVLADRNLGDLLTRDVLIQGRFRGQDTCIWIRIAERSVSQSDWARQMFHDFVRLELQSTLPIYPILVFFGESPEGVDTNCYQIEVAHRPVLAFNFVTIALDRLNWQDFLQQHNPVAAALMATMKIKSDDRPKVKAECLRLLTSLNLDSTRIQIISGFIDTYLRLNLAEEQVFEAELGRMGQIEEEGVMEIVTSWMEKGIEQGIQQGIERGIGLGIVVTVLRQLKCRFGSMRPLLEKQVRDLSLEQLEELSEALLEFKSESDLEDWLFQFGFREGLEGLLVSQLNYRFGPLSAELKEQINHLPIEHLERLGRALFEFEGEEDLVDWLTQEFDKNAEISGF